MFCVDLSLFEVTTGIEDEKDLSWDVDKQGERPTERGPLRTKPQRWEMVWSELKSQVDGARWMRRKCKDKVGVVGRARSLEIV